jgi:hypothetical protein
VYSSHPHRTPGAVIRVQALLKPPVSGSFTPEHRRSFLPGIDDVHRGRIENLEFRVVFGYSSTPGVVCR